MLRVRVCLLGQRAVRIEVGVKDGRPRASSEMTTTCEGGVSVVQPRCFICDEHHLQGLGSIKSQEMVQRPLFSLASPWARYFNLTRGWPSLSLLFLWWCCSRQNSEATEAPYQTLSESSRVLMFLSACHWKHTLEPRVTGKNI